MKNAAMHSELDLALWPRRDSFELFRRFDKPYFSVCVRVDVSALKPALKQVGVGGVTLACHFVALDLANRIAPFRYRLQGDGVRVYERIDGSTTVLKDDESFGFAYFDHDSHYPRFAERAAPALAAARSAGAVFAPRSDEQALIHCTTLPWLHFTSFSHARNWGRPDAVPKLAFGRIAEENGRSWMPLSVEVHHGLMDGLHVGRYVMAFEAAMRDPLPWLQGQPLTLP